MGGNQSQKPIKLRAQGMIFGQIVSQCHGGAACNARLRRDRHLKHPVTLMTEQIIGGLDIIQFEPMCDHRPQINPPCCDDRHQAAHPFLAAGAQRGDDGMVAQSCGKGCGGNDQIAGINPKAPLQPPCACCVRAAPCPALGFIPAI